MSGYQGYDPRRQQPATPPQWEQRGYPASMPPTTSMPPTAWESRHPQQQPQFPPYYPPQQAARPPRRKRRVFLWVFLAVQALFLILIIVGVASHPAGPSAAAQAARQCANGGWQGLFTSQADCRQHYAVALNDAGNVGKGLGVAIIVIVWIVIDFFLGLGYGVYRLAGRR